MTSELENLKAYLDKHGYNNKWHEVLSPKDQIIVYDDKGKRVWDAICHRHSYGGEKGLLEIYGNICDCDDVIGWLTAKEVVKILEERNGK
jgi:hypothetical protein